MNGDDLGSQPTDFGTIDNNEYDSHFEFDPDWFLDRTSGTEGLASSMNYVEDAVWEGNNAQDEFQTTNNLEHLTTLNNEADAGDPVSEFGNNSTLGSNFPGEGFNAPETHQQDFSDAAGADADIRSLGQHAEQYIYNDGFTDFDTPSCANPNHQANENKLEDQNEGEARAESNIAFENVQPDDETVGSEFEQSTKERRLQEASNNQLYLPPISDVDYERFARPEPPTDYTLYEKYPSSPLPPASHPDMFQYLENEQSTLSPAMVPEQPTVAASGPKSRGLMSPRYDFLAKYRAPELIPEPSNLPGYLAEAPYCNISPEDGHGMDQTRVKLSFTEPTPQPLPRHVQPDSCIPTPSFVGPYQQNLERFIPLHYPEHATISLTRRTTSPSDMTGFEQTDQQFHLKHPFQDINQEYKIPRWFPGAAFTSKAASTFQATTLMVHSPFPGIYSMSQGKQSNTRTRPSSSSKDFAQPSQQLSTSTDPDSVNTRLPTLGHFPPPSQTGVINGIDGLSSLVDNKQSKKKNKRTLEQVDDQEAQLSHASKKSKVATSGLISPSISNNKRSKPVLNNSTSIVDRKTTKRPRARKQGNQATPSRNQHGAWSKREEAVCIQAMKMVKSSGVRMKNDDIWIAVSSQMRTRGCQRSPQAIKNTWNRHLRALSGIDERCKPRPDWLQTGLLNKKDPSNNRTVRPTWSSEDLQKVLTKDTLSDIEGISDDERNSTQGNDLTIDNQNNQKTALFAQQQAQESRSKTQNVSPEQIVIGDGANKDFEQAQNDFASLFEGTEGAAGGDTTEESEAD